MPYAAQPAGSANTQRRTPRDVLPSDVPPLPRNCATDSRKQGSGGTPTATGLLFLLRFPVVPGWRAAAKAVGLRERTRMKWRCFLRHKWRACVCERCGQTRASDHRAHRWQGCACRTCGITRHRLVSGICTECRVRILDHRSVHFGPSSPYDTALTAHACLKPEPAFEPQRTQAGAKNRSIATPAAATRRFKRRNLAGAMDHCRSSESGSRTLRGLPEKVRARRSLALPG